jgi:hypothetical protein
MRKIITIAILFFSYLSFAQSRPVVTLSVEKSETSTTVSNGESTIVKTTMLTNGNETCGNFYKKKSNEITENPLNDITLTLPNNFNWLHRCIV